MRTFKLNEKVIALKSSPNERCQPREKGKIYTVTMIINCQLCGMEMININNNVSQQMFLTCSCNHNMNNFGRCFTKAKYFAPIDEIDKLILTCVEDENYEDAEFFNKIKEEILIEK